MNWCNSTGCSWFCLLSESTWMQRGPATRSWFVFPFVLYCLRILCAFSLLGVYSIILNGMYRRILSRCINCAKSHWCCSVEFEEKGEEARVLLGTWDKDISCVSTLDRHSGNDHQEVSTLSSVIDRLRLDVSVVSTNGGSTNLLETFCKYLGSGYQQKLIDYPCFDSRLFKRCLQPTASRVFGNLHGFAMTEFIVYRLKGAQKQDYMFSRPVSKKAILTNDLGIPHLVDIVANIIGVWPLIVPYLKETGRKYDDDNRVVRSSSFDCISAFPYLFILCLWCLEEGYGRIRLLGSNGAHEVFFVASPSWNLQVFSYNLSWLSMGTWWFRKKMHDIS